MEANEQPQVLNRAPGTGSPTAVPVVQHCLRVGTRRFLNQKAHAPYCHVSPTFPSLLLLQSLIHLTEGGGLGGTQWATKEMLKTHQALWPLTVSQKSAGYARMRLMGTREPCTRAPEHKVLFVKRG